MLNHAKQDNKAKKEEKEKEKKWKKKEKSGNIKWLEFPGQKLCVGLRPHSLDWYWLQLEKTNDRRDFTM